MSAESHNLLAATHRWARRADENFVSEAFVHLLRTLLADSASQRYALQMINFVTAGRLSISGDLVPAIEVRTQVTEERGRPDIEIRAPGRLAYLEVKLESELEASQLSRYRAELAAKTDRTFTALGLITRYETGRLAPAEEPDIRRRWYEIAGEVERIAAELPVSRCAYVAEQFLEFMHYRGLTMDRVTWELGPGVRALRSLLLMIEASLGKRERRRSSGVDYDGFLVKTGKHQAWVGVMAQQPEVVRFTSNDLPLPDKVLETLGFGALEPYSYAPTGHQWVATLHLASEDVHFFAKGKERQLACLEEFVGKCMAAMDSLGASAAVL